jgi:hypothetical protein
MRSSSGPEMRFWYLVTVPDEIDFRFVDRRDQQTQALFLFGIILKARGIAVQVQTDDELYCANWVDLQRCEMNRSENERG